MDEYKLLTSILSDTYICSNQNQMTEINPKGKIVQLTSINKTGKGLLEYKLYRFDSGENKDFLEFFNNSNDAPKELRSFCDYILFTNHLGKLKIFLIELKSGTNSHAHKQLEASKCFIEYLKITANRIKDENNYTEYSDKNISVVKILVKNVTTGFTTKVKNEARIDFVKDGSYYRYATTIFDINYVCRHCTYGA